MAHDEAGAPALTYSNHWDHQIRPTTPNRFAKTFLVERIFFLFLGFCFDWFFKCFKLCIITTRLGAVGPRGRQCARRDTNQSISCPSHSTSWSLGRNLTFNLNFNQLSKLLQQGSCFKLNCGDGVLSYPSGILRPLSPPKGQLKSHWHFPFLKLGRFENEGSYFLLRGSNLRPTLSRSCQFDLFCKGKNFP